MEPENIESKELQINSLSRVTPLSKYLAMVLFILMPFFGGWIGYTYAPEKVIEVEKIIVQKVTVPNSLKQEDDLTILESVDDLPLSPYIFKSYATSSNQFFVAGELLPVMVELSSTQNNVTEVSLRCWKKEMYCSYSQNFTKWNVRQLDLLSVEDWTKDQIIIKGLSGNFPDCAKDSCSYEINIAVNLNTEEVKLKSTLCGGACATDEFIIVGKGYGTYQERIDLPKPLVNIVDVSF